MPLFVADDDLYAVLGVSPTASNREIDKAYYADPAHAVPASWGWTAPQYGTDSAVNFTGLVQARGIVW